MRSITLFLLIVMTSPSLASAAPIHTKDRSAMLKQIRSAKSVYFEDQTGVPNVGAKAAEELKKWGRFRMVTDRNQADLVILLSATPYKDGHIVFSGGQTGSIDGGKVAQDSVPDFNRAASARYAILTVIDPKSGEQLWSASHQWGGLLTGFDSAGARLVKKLKKHIR